MEATFAVMIKLFSGVIKFLKDVDDGSFKNILKN
jgi:hypothetical protein